MGNEPALLLAFSGNILQIEEKIQRDLKKFWFSVLKLKNKIHHRFFGSETPILGFSNLTSDKQTMLMVGTLKLRKTKFFYRPQLLFLELREGESKLGLKFCNLVERITLSVAFQCSNVPERGPRKIIQVQRISKKTTRKLTWLDQITWGLKLWCFERDSMRGEP